MSGLRSHYRVSVIIPTLNEALRIGARLDELAAIGGWYEILVVDGGSTDGTRAIAQRPGVQLIDGPRGRASQMNAAAARATGDVLLFLHADVVLPADAHRWIAAALTDPSATGQSVVAGAFRTWTVADLEGHWWAPALHLADLRSRYSLLPYGDQALFVRAAAFTLVGGFPDQPLLEDLELSRRLRRIGRIRTVRARVRVSGRRFLQHPIYYTFLVNVLPAMYYLGVPARTLARLYGNPR